MHSLDSKKYNLFYGPMGHRQQTGIKSKKCHYWFHRHGTTIKQVFKLINTAKSKIVPQGYDFGGY